MSAVRLDRLTKTYEGQDRPALSGFSLDIASGEFLVLVGPSGCGKSTALRSIAGLEVPDTGSVWIGGRDVTEVPPRDRNIAMVFQNYALYPHMTVYDNLAFGLKLRKTPKPEIDERVKEAAALLGLDGYLERKPKALSGGERQRVALGRALVRRPDVFLFDEPLSNLDAQLRVHMRAELHKLHQKLDATMIYVTHDQVEAMTLGDRIAVLKGGILQQVDAPLTVYERPVNKFVAGFLGSPSMNFVDAAIDGAAVKVGDARWPADGALAAALAAHAGAKVTAGVRPEHLALSDAAGALKGQIEFSEVLGAERLLYVQTAAGRLVVRVAPDQKSAIGANVGLMPEAGSLRVFDSAEMAVGVAAPVVVGA